MRHRASLRVTSTLAALLTSVLVLVVAPVATTPAQAVVGGSSAVGNTAVVRILNGSSSCSGALWTSRIVVTAAHCVVNSSGTVTTRPSRDHAATSFVVASREMETPVISLPSTRKAMSSACEYSPSFRHPSTVMIELWETVCGECWVFTTGE
ncbi:MAG: trypsin-like serine protease [Actinomycetota bacterium]